MKKLLLILFAVFASISSFSQDIITLKTGDEIKSKVLEVSNDQVKYKKWENIDGPTYTSLKSEVFMIKYQNGTKDVFNTQQSININNTPVSNEDVKKNEALKKLENYVKNKISSPIFRVEGFRKTNGVMNTVFGQMIYTINCDIDIKFTSDGWKKGNALEGYWSSFYVYPSEPNLSATGEQYMYATKLYQRGTLLTLGCAAEMNNTDNGFEVKKLSIKTITNHGIVPDSYQSNTASTTNFKGSESNIKPKVTPTYIGDYKDGKREGKGKQIYEDGSMYVGDWKNDLRDGYGTFKDGNYISQGYWKNDIKEGEGVETVDDIIIYKGIYRNGKHYTGHFYIFFREGSVYDNGYATEYTYVENKKTKKKKVKVDTLRYKIKFDE